MATLHLMIGLPCSGKTTFAKKLAEDTGALVLSLDAWHVVLFGNDTLDARHDERHRKVEQLMWEVARHVLGLGGDVILDYGCWARQERDDYRARAAGLGVGFVLHYMNTPINELYRRLEARNANLPSGTFTIPKQEMDRYITLFQPPQPEELAEQGRALSAWEAAGEEKGKNR